MGGVGEASAGRGPRRGQYARDGHAARFNVRSRRNRGQSETTVRTVDGSLSAQFEHTCLVTKTGVEVLTKRDKPLRMSENVATVFAG
jgi:hypothetical protein